MYIHTYTVVCTAPHKYTKVEKTLGGESARLSRTRDESARARTYTSVYAAAPYVTESPQLESAIVARELTTSRRRVHRIVVAGRDTYVHCDS